MLVLSRKQSQRIRLGDSIVITVVRVRGDKVRLGIEAPRDMLVLRDELSEFGKEDEGTPSSFNAAVRAASAPTKPEPPSWVEFASDAAAEQAKSFTLPDVATPTLVPPVGETSYTN
jgi:carbon storage regulator